MALKEEIYKEIGVNYRFFLAWRHASIVGYLVVLGAVVSLGITVFKEARDLLWIVPLCATPIGFVLWLVDIRTRDIYHAAVRAGKEMESPEKGFFTVVANEVAIQRETKRTRKITHSMAIGILFNGGSIFLLALSVLLYIWYG